MSEINWELVKFQYEVLGMSLPDLASQYNLSLSHIELAAEDWVRIPLAERKALVIEDTSSMEKVTEQMLRQVREQARTSSILKQKHLGPKYMALEVMLLSKATEVLQNLDINDRNSATAVKTLTSVLKDLLEHNTLINAEGDKEEFGDGGGVNKWEITIVEPEAKRSE